MPDPKPRSPQAGPRELIASFPTRPALQAAIRAVTGGGFAAADLSVLATHQSLDALKLAPKVDPTSPLMASLTDEAVFLNPLTIATISLLSSGNPAAAGMAAVAEAGLGISAIKEVFDRLAANRKGQDLLKSVQEGGLLLWVRVADKEQDARARRLLAEAGGTAIHLAPLARVRAKAASA